MNQSASNKKGNTFENETARELSEWTGDSIIRNQFTETGDMFTQPSFPFSVECKHHQSIPFARFLWTANKIGNWGRFWIQCTRDAQAKKKLPMLVFRENRGPKLVAFNRFDFSNIQDLCGTWNGRKITMAHPELGVVVIVDFHEFLQWADYETIKRLVK